MDNLHLFLRGSAIAILSCQPFLIQPAYTQGLQMNNNSASLQGNAMAGAGAAVNDVSALFINPATLATLKNNQAYFSGSELLPHISIDNASAIHAFNVPGILPLSILAPVQGVNAQHNIADSLFIPSGYIGLKIDEKISAGLAIVRPYELSTHYSANSVLRFEALNTDINSFNINPAISYKLHEKISLGLGLQAQYLKTNLSNFNGMYTGNTTLDAMLAANNPSNFNAHGWGYGYSLGLLLNPDAQTRIGVGFSSSISTKLNGDGQQYTWPGPVVPAPSNAFLFNAQTAVKTKITTPATLNISAAHDLSHWSIKASTGMNFWNTFNNININTPHAYEINNVITTRWKNSWFGAVGADYHPSTILTLRGGLAFDDPTSRNMYQTPRIPDSKRTLASVGATFIINKLVSIDGSYGHSFMQHKTMNLTSARGSSITSTTALEVNQLAANYKMSANILALGIRLSA